MLFLATLLLSTMFLNGQEVLYLPNGKTLTKIQENSRIIYKATNLIAWHDPASNIFGATYAIHEEIDLPSRNARLLFFNLDLSFKTYSRS